MILAIVASTSFGISAKQTTIIKSPNDSRIYESFTLDNGMEVLLASDPDLTQVAASLTVGVGQYQDPIAQQGLAHYLEHMIFMGSEKYPEPNALRNLVEMNNGVLNALTYAQTTSFYFRISSGEFETALGMLSNAIQAPLLLKEFSEKEIKAVDAEWKLLKQNATFAISRANALTASDKHPMRKMGIGNLTTLKNKKNSDLHAELKKFHQKYYSANIMKLALVGNQDLPKLKKLAVKYFSGMINKEIVRPTTSEFSILHKNTKKHIILDAYSEKKLLGLQFSLEQNTNNWKEKSNEYIAYLLSSEAPGALISSLRDAGLIESMQTIFDSSAYGNDGTAFIYFTLTEKGTQNKNEIIAAFFKYLVLIKNDGINLSYEQELKNILDNKFFNFHEPTALALANTFSSQMFNTPVTDILRSKTYFSVLDRKSIDKVLKQLTPKKLRIWHIGGQQEVDTRLDFATGSYRIIDIRTKDLKLWRSSNMALKLPAIAEIDKVSDMENVVRTLNKPKLVVKEEGVQAWLMHSEYFSNKQGVTGVTLQSTLYQKDVKHHVMTNILLMLINKDLQNMIQQASQRHQVHLNGSQNKHGDLTFYLTGITKRHPEYLSELLTLLKEVKFNKEDLDVALNSYRGMSEGIHNGSLPMQANYYSNVLLKTPPFIWSTKEKISAVNSLSLKELEQFQKDLIDSIYIELFSYGNYSETEVIKMANESRSLYGQTVLLEKPLYKDVFKPKGNTAWNEKKLIKQDHIMLKDTYIYPEASKKVAVQLRLLNNFFKGAFFEEFRTKQQLAYDIGSYQEYISQYPAFTLYIQSSNTDLKSLAEKFTDFIEKFETEFSKIDESVIEQAKFIMIKAIKQKPQDINAEFSRYVYDWLDGNYKFDSYKSQVPILERSHKKELLDLYKSMLVNGNSANVLIQLQGKEFRGTDFFN